MAATVLDSYALLTLLRDEQGAEKVRELMERVGLNPEHLNRFPHEFSGGQRQRLSIARAIVKHAPIMIFDEATSSVDTETEKAIQSNLNRLTAGKTAVIIAHRLSTIRNADTIIVIEKGRIIEHGTHDSLVLNESGVYSDLWHTQIGLGPNSPQ